MPTYRTPNVYIEEVPTIPPSVVPVATAVPAFIGYTEKAGNGNELQHQPVRISSILDYTSRFGGAYPTSFKVNVAEDAATKTHKVTNIAFGAGATAPPQFLMYYALRLFFDNGGGPCYVVSIGNYAKTKPDKNDFSKGLEAISKEDEPTLLLVTDAINFAQATDYYDLCVEALKQCAALKDRFAIFDVLASDGKTNKQAIGKGLREGIGTNDLKYGAAYYPYLQTSLTHYFTEQSVAIYGLSSESEQPGSEQSWSIQHQGLKISYKGTGDQEPKVKINRNSGPNNITFELADALLTIKLPKDSETPVSEIVEKWDEIAEDEKGSFSLEQASDGESISNALGETNLTASVDSASIDSPDQKVTLDKLISKDNPHFNTELHNAVKAALNTQRVNMPPSSAVAGAYAKVDRERGVWKAPANVSLASVIGPTVKITNEDQDRLNVDATTGKSINAIRSFVGKGTLIWGARTLAGNDNEWRYVPVRRLFNLIEESIQKATAFAVFESNNAVTWLKIKTIIESYLDSLWRQGALLGTTQKAAFFVKVGLGQTMTEQDIFEGRMIVEIGVAAVRPAEFIVLRFSHKLQQA